MIDLLKECINSKVECVESHLVGRAQKSWIDVVNYFLEKKILMRGNQDEWCMLEVNGLGL